MGSVSMRECEQMQVGESRLVRTKPDEVAGAEANDDVEIGLFGSALVYIMACW